MHLTAAAVDEDIVGDVVVGGGSAVKTAMVGHLSSMRDVVERAVLHIDGIGQIAGTVATARVVVSDEVLYGIAGGRPEGAACHREVVDEAASVVDLEVGRTAHLVIGSEFHQRVGHGESLHTVFHLVVEHKRAVHIVHRAS